MDEPVWLRQERRVSALLPVHPLLEGLVVVVTGNARAINAAIQDERGADLVEVRVEAVGWWEPDTPGRGEEIAERLAHALFEQWRNRNG